MASAIPRAARDAVMGHAGAVHLPVRRTDVPTRARRARRWARGDHNTPRSVSQPADNPAPGPPVQRYGLGGRDPSKRPVGVRVDLVAEE
jgi:hypothetical protein